MMKKEVIYIDIDDDITGIIDRVSTSKDTITALVLPKRAQVLHSSVNMRLLKRAADDNKKRLVLITTEAPVLKLAAMVRVHVAKSLTSKPTLPAEPEDEITETIIAEEPTEDIKPDAKKSIGELAGDKLPLKVVDNTAPAVVLADGEEETIELDNLEETEAAPLAAETSTKVKKDKKLKVPNFDKFRVRLFIGGAIALLILVGGFFALFVLPKAQITVKTETSDISTKLDFTVNTTVAAVDDKNNIIPAQLKELKQTITEKVTATGSLDKGDKAKGVVTLYNCNKEFPPQSVTLPANSRITVGDSLFRTDAPVTITPSTFSYNQTCLKNKSIDVNVTAELAGDKYNLSERDGFYAPDYADISGTSKGNGGFAGGTSNVVKVISQSDVDAIKQKILLRNTDADKNQLTSLLKAASQLPLTETFTSTPAEPTIAPGVGQEASEGTVTMVITYQMLGIAQKDIDQLVKKDQDAKINTATQKVYSNGVSTAKFGVLERKSAGEAKLNLNATGKVGPQLDATAMARDVAGKTGGETKSIIMSRPGIASVDVRYDPFWVLKTPKKVSRITITFDVQN